MLAPAPGSEGVLTVFHQGRVAGDAYLAVVAAVLHIHQPVAAGAPDGQALAVGRVFIGGHAGHTQTGRKEGLCESPRVAQTRQGMRQDGQKKRQRVQGQSGVRAGGPAAVRRGQRLGMVLPVASMQQREGKAQRLPDAHALEAWKGQMQLRPPGPLSQAVFESHGPFVATGFAERRQHFLAPGFGPAGLQQARKQPVIEACAQRAAQCEIVLIAKAEGAVFRQQGHAQGQMAPGLGHGPDPLPAFHDLFGHVNGPGREQGFPVGSGQIRAVRAKPRGQGGQAVHAESLRLFGCALQNLEIAQRFRREGEAVFPVGKKVLHPGKAPRPGGPMRLRRGPARHGPQRQSDAAAQRACCRVRQGSRVHALSRSVQCSTVSSGRSRRARRPSTSS